MWFVYVLRSKRDGSSYIGCTGDLKKRLSEHKEGKSKYTRDKRPWKLIYYEYCLNKRDAFRRERYLKSGWGTKWLKVRLKSHWERIEIIK